MADSGNESVRSKSVGNEGQNVKRPDRTPQEAMNQFWDVFTHKYPGKISQILPSNPYAASKSAKEPKGKVHGTPARESYEEAKADCIKAVDAIGDACRLRNLRYRDPHFDIEFDLKTKIFPDCLIGLQDPYGEYPNITKPRGVKRVHQIFKNPKFYIEGAKAVDIRQGVGGDCWFLSALGSLGSGQGLDLIERVCVHRHEDVGVYGFVFHRDGEWIHTIIDDKLYLKHADYHESFHERKEWSRVGNRADSEEEYRKAFQEGSRALYFAQCTLENETWLPLLEKAFAKAHGHYDAINGGYTGEAIEDLTGGVTTELFTSDILDLDKFWEEELLQVNKQFLFGCATGRFDEWQGGPKVDRKGIQSKHAYSIMEAREEENEGVVYKLLKIRNPWGKTEWSGAWSDGSAEWNQKWTERIQHNFGDDGIFWISYEDWLKKYHFLDRTRLFNSDWQVTQKWTSLQVPWSAEYNSTKFTFELTEPGPIVIVLSQLDDRYWYDFRGQYIFSLRFRINKSGEDKYIVRSHNNYCMKRSVSIEHKLPAGTYDVRMKITAFRDQDSPGVDEMVRWNVNTRMEKVFQLALSYDLAHAKGISKESDEEQRRRADRKMKEELKAKEQARAEAKEIKYKYWTHDRRLYERDMRQYQRRKDREARKGKEAANSERHTGDYVEDDNSDQDEGDDDDDERTPPSQPGYSNPRNRSVDPREDYDQHRFQQQTPQERIDEFNRDLALQSQRSATSTSSMPTSFWSFNSSIDSELDHELFARYSRDALKAQASDNGSDDEKLDSELEVFASDPWNAECVVGLRVFTRNGQAIVKVIKPDDDVSEEGITVDKDGVTHGGNPAPLDIDDPARGLSQANVGPKVGNGGDGKNTATFFPNAKPIQRKNSNYTAESDSRGKFQLPIREEGNDQRRGLGNGTRARGRGDARGRRGGFGRGGQGRGRGRRHQDQNQYRYVDRAQAEDGDQNPIDYHQAPDLVGGQPKVRGMGRRKAELPRTH